LYLIFVANLFTYWSSSTYLSVDFIPVRPHYDDFALNGVRVKERRCERVTRRRRFGPILVSHGMDGHNFLSGWTGQRKRQSLLGLIFLKRSLATGCKADRSRQSEREDCGEA
jgi:hypothetical protein